MAIIFLLLLFFSKKEFFLKLFSFAQETGNKVSLREDGLLMVNNQPFFPIGFYNFPPHIGGDNKRNPSPETGLPWQEVAEAGFNTFIGWSKKYQHYLEKLEEYNLKFFLKAYWYTRPENTEALNDLFALLKPEKAFLGYYSHDEPFYNEETIEAGRHAALKFPGYEIINQKDPNHPVLTIHGIGVAKELTDEGTNCLPHPSDASRCWAGDHLYLLDEWNKDSHTQITGVDVYPLGRPGYEYFIGDLTSPGQWAERSKKVFPENKAVFSVIQAFSWNYYNSEFPRQYPSFEQLRFMTFDAIVHGAKGIFYWGLKQANEEMCNFKYQTTEEQEACYSTPTEFQNSQLWKDLKKLASTLSWPKVYDALTAPKAETTIEPVKQGVVTLAKNDAGRLVVFVVNENEENQTVTLKGFPSETEIRVLNEDRTVKTNESGEITEFLAGYGIHIYEFGEKQALAIDLNNDGQVDIEDVKLLLSSFFTANFDLNSDSLVNGIDFAKIRKEIF